MNKGFTLIETIIYIALFTLLITSGFVSVYQLISGTDSLNTKIRIQKEGNFVLRKISWTLTGLNPLNPPTVGGSGCYQALTSYKTGQLNPIRIRMSNISGNNYVEIQDDGINYYPITTINASTTCLKFGVISGTPSGIVSTITINGIDFVITKYVRS